MLIITELLSLLESWRPVFVQQRTFRQAVQVALATLCVVGRNTVSQRITLLGWAQRDWTRVYRLFNRRVWDAQALFDAVVHGAQRWCPGRYLVVAADDTLLRKTGKHVYNVGYLRDPLSPKFRYNLQLGLRYLQLSLLLPLYATAPAATVSACALPIRWALAAVLRKPRGKKFTASEQEAFELAKQANTLSKYLWDQLTQLRKWLNTQGYSNKWLLLVADNGYCNQTIFGTVLKGLQVLARANYRLFLRDATTGRAVEGKGITPNEVRTDKTHRWQTTTVHFGGRQHHVRYKEIACVYWPGGAGDRVLRLLVVAGLPYRRRKTAKICYREPGYLLTTDLRAPVAFLIQSYFDRWQIEVNHRDEKTVIGVGQAQVHTEEAVRREPAFAVAAYSLVKLAALRAFGPTRTADYQELPAWYAGAKRPSCEDMLQKLRHEVCEHPELVASYGVRITKEGLLAANRA